jgi:hypothetical protein
VANAPVVFFYLRIVFFATDLKGASKKYKYLQNDCLGGEKPENE